MLATALAAEVIAFSSSILPAWADLLRGCKRRGTRAPVLAVGDGALGFWKALREVFPDRKEQRCWRHEIDKVLAALPKSAQPAARPRSRR